MLSEQQESDREELHALRDRMDEIMMRHKHVAQKSHDSAVCAICDAELGWWCPKSPDNTCHYYSMVDSEGKVLPLVELLDGVVVPITDKWSLKNLNHQTMDTCLFCGQPEERL